MDIQNNIAIITGGGSGMGAATARLFSQYGAKVVLLDTNIEAAERVAQESSGYAMQCDVTNTENVQDVLAYTTQHFGVPRICINCAGIVLSQRIVGKNGVMPLAEFKRVIDINLIGTFNVMRLCAELMTKLDPQNVIGERGVIINTASIAATEGQTGQTAYSASKAGIVGLTLPAARELARFGIRVMTIAPGLVSTPMLFNMSQTLQDNLLQAVPFPGKFGEPQNFAMLAMHIVENYMLNGSVIRLDAAMRLPYEK